MNLLRVMLLLLIPGAVEKENAERLTEVMNHLMPINMVKMVNVHPKTLQTRFQMLRIAKRDAMKIKLVDLSNIIHLVHTKVFASSGQNQDISLMVRITELIA